MRIPRTLAVTAAVLVSVTWGASASAAPHQAAQQGGPPAQPPIVVSHLMSSCGNMDGV